MRIAAGLAVAASLLTACSGGGTARDETPADATTYRSTEWVTYAEHESVPSNDRWPESVRQVLRRATGLVEAHKADLLGAYIDGDGEVVVVSGTPKGADLVDKAFPDGGVTAETAPVTIESAATTGEEIRQLSPGLERSIYEWGGRPQVDGMFVAIRVDLDDDDRATLEQFAEDRELPLLVELDIGAPLPSLA
jgi:hypothetical protein